MLAMPQIVLVGLLGALPAEGPEAQVAQVPVERDARVEIVAPHQTIRGRVADLTADTIVVDTHDGRMTVPMQSVQRISRVGDSVANGAAIGAAIGGASTLSLMAKLCTNSNCSDISSNLDPRFALLGTLIGAGIGALVDGLYERRTPVYRAGPDQAPVFAPPSQPQRQPREVMVFGRAGGGQLNDDEGSLGSGGTWGTGVQYHWAADGAAGRLRPTESASGLRIRPELYWYRKPVHEQAVVVLQSGEAGTAVPGPWPWRPQFAIAIRVADVDARSQQS